MISRICNVYVHKNWLTFYIAYVRIARCINMCLDPIRKAYLLVFFQDMKCKGMMFTTKSGNISQDYCFIVKCLNLVYSK